MMPPERHLFLGGARPKGSALVAPELEKRVAAQLGKEASILKERRKGREERELVAAAFAPGGGKHRKRGFLEAVACSVHGCFVTTSGIEP